MKWFRFYSEVLHDSKVQTLHPELFRAWVNLLCLANEGTERGRLPELKQIAFALRVKEDKAAQIVGQLTACGLIDADEQGGNRPHNWDRRQRDSDNVNTRVREYRKRKARVSMASDVTLHETDSERDGNALEERRVEENTPKPPGGASVGCAPIDNGDLEPFEAGSLSEPHAVPPPAFANDPAAVEQAIHKAERLFPGLHFGPKVSAISGDWPVGWINRGLDDFHASEKTNWTYFLGILRRMHADGGPKEPNGRKVRSAVAVGPAPQPLQSSAERYRNLRPKGND